MTAAPPPQPRPALFRVVRGEPSEEEVAALAVVLSAVAARGRSEAPKPAASRWSDPVSRLRVPLRPGPHAWRTSGWPG